MQDGHGQQPADQPGIDLATSTQVNPVDQVKRQWVKRLPPLSRVGYNLSIFILVIISGYILFLIIFLSVSKVDASARINISEQVNVPDSVFANKLQLIKALQEEKKNYRDFIMQITQLVLLNLLLPTLTAILGYIFGSKEGNRNVNADSESGSS